MFFSYTFATLWLRACTCFDWGAHFKMPDNKPAAKGDVTSSNPDAHLPADTAAAATSTQPSSPPKNQDASVSAESVTQEADTGSQDETDAPSGKAAADDAQQIEELAAAIEALHVQHLPALDTQDAHPDLLRVARLIQDGKCKRIICMCGAGISVSAGIPDFRTPGVYLELSVCVTDTERERGELDVPLVWFLFSCVFLHAAHLVGAPSYIYIADPGVLYSSWCLVFITTHHAHTRTHAHTCTQALVCTASWKNTSSLHQKLFLRSTFSDATPIPFTCSPR